MLSQQLAANWRKSNYSTNGGDCVECSSAAWSTSTYSGSNSNCVEYAPLRSSIAVRDSKHPGAGHLAFAGPEWAAFLTSVQRAGL